MGQAAPRRCLRRAGAAGRPWPSGPTGCRSKPPMGRCLGRARRWAGPSGRPAWHPCLRRERSS
eukprot:5822207-Pyramimonas_sp.AAC.1